METENPYKSPDSLGGDSTLYRSQEATAKISKIKFQLKALTGIIFLFIVFVVMLVMDDAASFEEFSQYGHYYVYSYFIIVLSFYVYLAKLLKGVGRSRVLWLGLTIFFSPLSLPIAYYFIWRGAKNKISELGVYESYA